VCRVRIAAALPLRQLYPQGTETCASLPFSAKPDPTHRNKKNMHYSITSSAVARRVGGTLMPSCFAVLALMTSLYVVGA
jgi:hypothetical protein